MMILYINYIIHFLTAVIATEAITELAVKSEFFEPLRKLMFESKYRILNWVHKIFDCGYCFSVWCSLLVVTLIFIFNNDTIYFLFGVIVVHRISNVVHFFIDRLQK